MSRKTKAWNFTRHFLEMCAAMCIGWAALGALFIGAVTMMGITDPLNQIPEVLTIAAAVNMTIPMAAWMRFRKMEWRPIAEMSASMFILAGLLIGLSSAGAVPRSDLLVLEHGLMMPAMLIPMFFRLDLYTGGHGAHAHNGIMATVPETDKHRHA